MSINHRIDWTEAFLAALRDVPVWTHASQVAGIDRTTAQKRVLVDKAFKEAVDAAMEAGIDRAEKEAFRRAVVGFEEPVVYQGQLTPVWARDEHGELVMQEYDTGEVYPKGHDRAGEAIRGRRPVQAKDANGQPMWLTTRKHSDALLALVLKGRRKAVYSDRTELTSPDGSMSPSTDEGTRAARAAQLMALAKQRQEAASDEPPADDFGDLA